MTYDAIILGAGGAGLFCALTAGRRGRRVLVIDHARKPGEKIRISGGGRCNFTNIHTSGKNFLSENPRFCLSALAGFKPADFIAMVDAHGIAWHEKTLGQLFCDGSSQQIIDMLLDECAKGGATIELETEVTSVAKGQEKEKSGFTVETSRGAREARSLVVATGGKSIPKMGATGFGYDIAKQFGLSIVPPRPALVPFTFGPELREQLDGLSGVSVDAETACGSTRFAEALLFTHRGLSGPAILQVSSYWKEGEEIAVNMAPGRDVFALLREARAAQPKQEVETALARLLPKSLAERLCAMTGTTGRLADLSDKRLRALAAHVNDWRVKPSGTEGYRTAEVTAGGVDTRGLSSKTMEARTVPGLYFIGEVVDVTGHLGGFNFQWAWASGYAAGRAL
ncbi:NAD(P)/FAD-dependent oxidoreductase [Parvibaculum sp.]|uniref:NAD(P)/FAD-dependent oxidoreductase n=1 Tax=Parvibaculum sp. TaxID=2024848 RepID=UPI001B285EC2|nr:NAD(P)/FAD-dependent oxidoreductase [Parvibaculum sp.]MBO6635609.1 NAD(P)/FAD-dependent oxidoreductase [Parvibaculum sp.]MBO6678980.1 NAD(P)/FAD-dependent oxidoreductase [Parvibaculum sp.]MBO6686702.1 NAD(P)/FAD-dependent oxidoreductase [Parvibaculum sp.]MBO6905738.1 NAD(P)/FAD-dependent oxidoreductase [Parvibaculum sp.]